MNKMVKLPLFLGGVCIVAAGLLAGVVALTTPIIENAKMEKLAQAYQNMYYRETISVLEVAELEDSYMEETGIQDVTKVGHNSAISIVYRMESKSAYEKLTFFVGISTETDAVDSYYFLESNTTSLGYGNFKNNTKVNGIYKGYTGDSTPIISGTTVTSKAVKAAIDIALEDYQTRVWGE